MLKDRYNPDKIEPKWQKNWEKWKLYETPDKSRKVKYYSLVMFPYPSGDLHIGHWYNFAPADTFSRFKRLQGYNVLNPFGFDAFGLPGENAAIKRNSHVTVWIDSCVERMIKQLKSMGPSYDWNRLINTSKKEYYKWTQWMFFTLFKAGLAYKAKAAANWCSSCKTILANEQVIDGACERCGTLVIQKDVEQWMFKITKYAEELISGLDLVDWPEKTKTAQRNWIGRSEGTLIKFPYEVKSDKAISVFTTRPDTIFGATFFILSPEHPKVWDFVTPQYKKNIEKYIQEAKHKTQLERMALQKQKTGVFTGGYVKNPLNGERIPVWIADYVLMTYGTGAVMGVPAHDQRDLEFANKYNLPVIEVVKPDATIKTNRLSCPERSRRESVTKKKEAYEGEGVLINSGEFNGLPSDKARKAITKWLENHNLGKAAVTYKLRDWIVSRQRYWGAPIPIIYCEGCGIVPVPEEELPVELPYIEDFQPTGTDIAPLAQDKAWVNTKCPKCQGSARRETDTMDTFVCSSWYYLRYVDPKNDSVFSSSELIEKWLPVDMYIGGAEHTVLHLLYSRFFTKSLRDLGYLKFSEPFLALRHQGIILGEDRHKMSKSRGNVVNPDDYVKKYGADTVRMYLCFMGPYDQGGPWDPKGILGVSRFLNRVWDFSSHIIAGYKTPLGVKRELHKLIKKITEDTENLKFNTAVAVFMEFMNFIQAESGGLSVEDWKIFLRLLAPFAPHLSEELWQCYEKISIHQQSWPEYDRDLVKEETAVIPVQINGKLRDQVTLPTESASNEEIVKELALKSNKVQKFLSGKGIKRVVFVERRLINFVVD